MENENQDLLTSPDGLEEDISIDVQPSSQPDFSQPAEVTADPNATESITLSVEDYNHIAVSSIPIGALSGAIFMIIGFAFLGIVKIFKKV